jgi:hypothetical protein
LEGLRYLKILNTRSVEVTGRELKEEEEKEEEGIAKYSRRDAIVS